MAQSNDLICCGEVWSFSGRMTNPPIDTLDPEILLLLDRIICAVVERDRLFLEGHLRMSFEELWTWVDDGNFTLRRPKGPVAEWDVIVKSFDDPGGHLGFDVAISSFFDDGEQSDDFNLGVWIRPAWPYSFCVSDLWVQ